MTHTEPDVSLEARYELRDAAKALGVSPSTLSKWTAAGKIRSNIKKINGRRCWLGKDLIRAWRMNY